MDLLTHIEKYVSLDSDIKEKILPYFTLLKVGKKEMLVEAGGPCEKHFFVMEGCLQLFFSSDRGHDQILQFALDGWWLTDYLAFRKGVHTEYSIQAVIKSKVLCITASNQERLLTEFPVLESYFRQIFEMAYGAGINRMRYQHDLSKEERYFHFVEAFPDFAQKVPQYAIASFLGLTPEYVSEIRKKHR